jgi:hypothetical protein
MKDKLLELAEETANIGPVQTEVLVRVHISDTVKYVQT